MKKLIIHTGTFHLDDLFLTYFVQKKYPNIEIERVKDVNEEDLNDPDVIVADIGGEYHPSLHNFDHHLDEIKNECALSLFLKRFWRDFFVNEFAYHIFREEYLNFIAKYDNGDINVSDYVNIPIIQKFVHNFNFYWNKSNNDVNFFYALNIFRPIFDNLLETINEKAKNVNKFFESKITDQIYYSDEFIIGWKAISLFYNLPVKIFINYDKARKQYNLNSINTEIFKFTEKDKKEIAKILNVKEDKIFMHKAGFIIAIPEQFFNKEKVIDYLKTIV